jgi:hypothetical protein
MHVEEDIEGDFLILFEDLTIDAQKRLLNFMGAEDASELNWNVFPLAVIPKGEINEEI